MVREEMSIAQLVFRVLLLGLADRRIRWINHQQIGNSPKIAWGQEWV